MPIKKLKFSTFESLDELMQVIDSKAWVALCSLVFLFFLGIIWLFFGKIPTKALGTGILLNISGMETVYSNVSGKINSIHFNIGQPVHQGEIIASILQWSLKNEIEKQQNKIQEQRIDLQEKKIIYEKQKNNFQRELNDYRAQLAILITLEKEGATSNKEIIDMRSKVTRIENAIDNLTIKAMQDENALHDSERELALMNKKYEQESVIRAPNAGVVIEISKNVDDIVERGDEILTLEKNAGRNSTLKAVIYIPAFEGKKVLPGMHVLVSPSTVKPEEYGSIIGKVSYVSAYPATFKSINRVLHNDEITKHMLSKGNQIEIQVELERSPHTISHYRWTSQEGPPILIQSGTLCDAKIIVKRKKPIEIIIPKIKKWAHMEEEF